MYFLWVGSTSLITELTRVSPSVSAQEDRTG